jgi:hypothetical protein
VAAVCDLDTEKAKDFADRLSAKKVYSDYQKILNDRTIDAVDIMLPTYLHTSVAVDAAEHKKHILCEKPFTLSLDEADAIINTAKDNGLTLMVAENTRFVKAYEVARIFLDRKAIGDVYPEINSVKLTDYKVRVLDSEAGTAAKVRVIVESADETSSWGTVGVSTNVIEASWMALVDSIEYKLMKGA